MRARTVRLATAVWLAAISCLGMTAAVAATPAPPPVTPVTPEATPTSTPKNTPKQTPTPPSSSARANPTSTPRANPTSTPRATPTRTSAGKPAPPNSDFAHSRTLTIVAEQITPTVVTSRSSQILTVTGTMTNSSSTTVSDVIVRFQRAERARDVRAVTAAISDPPGYDAMISRRWADGPNLLAPGESARFTLSIPIGVPAGARKDQPADGLGITTPGVYPILLNANGMFGDDQSRFPARVGELHLLLSVSSLPGQPAPDHTPARLLSVTQLASTPHRGLHGVFLNEDLGAAISGGLLDQRLRAVETAGASKPFHTLAVDPMLLDELTAMAAGYRVLRPGLTQPGLSPGRPSPAPPAVGTPQPQTSPSTPPPSFDETPTDTPGGPDTIDGAYRQAAARYLTRLRTVTATVPVILLPYSNPDIAALIKANVDPRLEPLSVRGRNIATRLLGSAPITTVALPPDGLLSPEMVSLYARAGYQRALVDRATLPSRLAEPQRSTALRLTGTDGGLVALADDGVFGNHFAAVSAANPAAQPLAVNALIALLAQRGLDADQDPIVQLPGSAGLSALPPAAHTAVAELVTDKLLGHVDLAALDPTTNLTPQLPAGARSLPTELVDRLIAVRTEVDTLRVAIPDRRAEPNLNILVNATTTLTSASLRTDPGNATAVLDTITDSTQQLRNGVELRISASHYALGAADSPLVLTVANNLPYQVTARVILSGGRSAGFGAQPSELMVLGAGDVTRVKIATHVARAGVFEITARLADATGALWSPPATLTIRSDAFAELTWWVVGLAGGFLIVMVFLTFRRRWRLRQQRLAAEAAGQPAPDASDGVTAIIEKVDQ